LTPDLDAVERRLKEIDGKAVQQAQVKKRGVVKRRAEADDW